MTPSTRGLIAITGAYTLSQFYRTYIAVIAPELSRDLGIGATGFGWLSSVFFLAFAAAQIPVGIAFDRYGVGRPSAWLMTGGIVSALLFAVAPHPAMSMVAQAGLGIACSPLFMGLIYYAARRLTEQRYVQVVSIVGAFGSVGALLAAAPLGWAAEHIGWRWAVALSAVLSLISTIALFRYVDDRPEQPPPRESLLETLRSCGALFLQPGIWPLIPVCLFLAAGSVFRNAWGGPYLASVFQLDAIARGQAMTVVSVLGLVGAFSVAPMVRRWTPKQVATGWLAAGTLGALVTAVLPGLSVGYAVFVMSLLFSVGNIHPLVMAQARTLLRPEVRGRGLGVLNAFVFIGAAGVSAVFGRIVDASAARGFSPAASYGWLFLTSALLFVVAMIFYRRSNST